MSAKSIITCDELFKKYKDNLYVSYLMCNNSSEIFNQKNKMNCLLELFYEDEFIGCIVFKILSCD
jgi:hypothetical protein